MSDNKLKPCPFCGSAASVHQDTSSDYSVNWDWFVICDNNDCTSELVSFESEDNAINGWNTRV